MCRVSMFLASAFALFCLTPPATADDWPQWLGPQRDGVWREDGIVDRLPDGGPAVKWRTDAALGYAGPAVRDGRVYLMDYVKTSGKIGNRSGRRDKLQGSERITCLDAATGKVLWRHQYDQPYEISFAGGPRCTPTVVGGKVHALGAEGRLSCLDAAKGTLLWTIDFKQKYSAPTPQWGFAAHPLVDDGTLYCLVGGPGSVVVAFDADTGTELWKALDAKEQGYCPPTMIEHAGGKQLVIWHAESINGLDPASGKSLWSVPLKPAYGMSIAAPIKAGSQLFASGVGDTSVLLELTNPPGAEIVWRGTPKTAVYSANATPVIQGDVIYGCDGSGKLVCAKLADSRRLWETAQPTTGDRAKKYATVFLVPHADRFFLFNDSGDLILAKLSPQGYEELGRANILEPTNTAMGRDVVWSHPAFAEKCVFARNDKEIVCVSLAAE